MLQPDVGQLLSGMRGVLSTSVLPAVQDPAAQRQLKAALHLMGRLSRSWDVGHAMVREDNADIEAVLSALKTRIQAAGFVVVVTGDETSAPSMGKLNDPWLLAQEQKNQRLRSSLEAMEQFVRADLPQPLAAGCLEDLHKLFERMTERESVVAGDHVPPAASEIANV
jgi:hypothetical protein